MEWFISLSLSQQFLTVYFLIINIITFFFFGLDKIKSQTNSRRVSEAQLLFLVFIGGALGGLAGMKFFRHKTKKVSFQSALIIILAVQITLLVYFLGVADVK